MIPVSDRYFAIGNEAPLAGAPLYVINFTDSKKSCLYRSGGKNPVSDDKLSEAQLKKIIIRNTENYPGLNILFRGTDILLFNIQEKLLDIITGFPKNRFYIETLGTFPVSINTPENCHYIAECKSPSANGTENFCIDNIRLLNPEKDYLKFIVDKNDMSWLLTRVRFIQSHCPNLHLFAFPQWEDSSYNDFAEFIINHRLNLNLSVQIRQQQVSTG